MTLREQPGLIRYLAAAVLGRVADEGGRIVLVLLAIDRTGSTAVGGLLAGCFLVPHVIAAPISGAIADRSPHRARVQGAALVTFGFCLALVAILAGNVPNGVLMVVAIIGGCAGPLLTGGMTSLLGNLVPGATRDRAYGLDIATYNLAGIVGPAAGAMLAALVSPMIATFALGASALAGGILVVRLPGEKPSGQYGRPAVETSLLSLDAMRHMVRNPSLRTATIVSSLGAAGTAALPIAAVLIGQEANRSGLTSGCIATFALGSLAGSVWYARRPFGTDHPTHTAIICLGWIAVPFLVIPLVPHWSGIVLLCGVAGIPTSPLGSSVFLVRDRESEPSIRTQIFTLGAGIKMTCSAIGTSIAGFAASAGSTSLFVGIAVVQLASAAIGTFTIRRQKRIIRSAASRRS
jgi:MFS family permease